MAGWRLAIKIRWSSEGVRFPSQAPKLGGGGEAYYYCRLATQPKPLKAEAMGCPRASPIPST